MEYWKRWWEDLNDNMLCNISKYIILKYMMYHQCVFLLESSKTSKNRKIIWFPPPCLSFWIVNDGMWMRGGSKGSFSLKVLENVIGCHTFSREGGGTQLPPVLGDWVLFRYHLSLSESYYFVSGSLKVSEPCPMGSRTYKRFKLKTAPYDNMWVCLCLEATEAFTSLKKTSDFIYYKRL